MRAGSGNISECGRPAPGAAFFTSGGAVVGTARASGFGNVVRALSNRNYRIYTVGNAISLVGTWLQRVAASWLTWELTHSGTWLGLVAFADLFPVMVLSPVAGSLADRYDRVAVIRVTQVIAMAQAIALAVFTATGIIDIWSLFLLTVTLGAVNAMNQPARLALIPSLVDRETLPSAVAINSIVFNNARFAGPLVAAAVTALGSISLAFALNAVTYVAFLVSLHRIGRVAGEGQVIAHRRRMLAETLEGYLYVIRHPGIGPMMGLFAASSLAARGFIELLSGFAGAVFHVGPQGFFGLVASTGLGAMSGGLWMVLRRPVGHLTGLVVTHTLLIAVALVGFTATDIFWLALPCLFVAGAGLVVTGIAAQTLVQTAVAPTMRGRVMGLYGMIFRGGPAMNALTMGLLSSQFGLRLPLAAGALICVALWAWARWRQGALTHALEIEPTPAPAD